MVLWLKAYWWALQSIVVIAVLLRYRLLKRGGNEPFLRRLLYAFSPNADPANEKRSKLSIWVVVLVLCTITFGIAFDFYNTLYG
jgi:hypothetical protein